MSLPACTCGECHELCQGCGCPLGHYAFPDPAPAPSCPSCGDGWPVRVCEECGHRWDDGGAAPAPSAGLHDECRAEIDRLWDQIANTSADMTLAAAFASTMPAPAIDADRLERALRTAVAVPFGVDGSPHPAWLDLARKVAAAYAADGGEADRAG